MTRGMTERSSLQGILGDQANMKIIYTDVLVIGAGLAGLRMAVAVQRRGQDAIVLSLCPGQGTPTPGQRSA